jgi:hypothetical protein
MFGFERFGQERCIGKLFVQLDSVVPGNENKRRAASVQGRRNRLDAFPAQGRVEHGRVAIALVENGKRLVGRIGAARYLEPRLTQRLFNQESNKRLILDDEYPCGYRISPVADTMVGLPAS